ncbi:putative guanosine-diphosphatase [Smittium mucronatum]|uniref:guanosine-diphosphatase n=1 Tax=Smittium mucronatum TaxID=133383 RepID=A0A1R0GQ32_9FUNG|nr:putative guanosine-diphosphatase [Smittium mucronatum]
MGMLQSIYRSAFDGNYSPLGSSELSASQKRFKRSQYLKRTWLRVVGLVAGLLFLFFLLRNYVSEGNSEIVESNLTQAEIDPRLSSIHCENPTAGKPLIQYVLMIDAGSTGSRIHVYKFNNCRSRPELEDEIFEQIKPGLSSFDSDSEGAAKSLDGLMDIALANIPDQLRSCTPVSVKATAGLRLLGEEKSQKILNAVKNRLAKNYPFQLAKEENPVAVMEGVDEGVYAWVTVNYLLNSLGTNGSLTAGTFDLGGGSAQIVFEPSFKSRVIDAPSSSQHDDHIKFTMVDSPLNRFKYDFKYNKLNYKLYQNSYLGYGLMSARDKMFKEISKLATSSQDPSVAHPCFPGDYEKIFSHKDSSSTVKISGVSPNKTSNASDPSLSNFKQCLPIAKSVLNISENCDHKPCSFNGVYQPDLDDTFKANPFYIFSYFYDRTDPFGLGDQFKLKDIESLAEKVCQHDHSVFSVESHKTELKAEKHTCLDLSYIYSLLKYGVGFSDERVFKTARKISDIETGWCLGAALAVLDQHSYCKA